jgi:gliding motility-associated protein GldE
MEDSETGNSLLYLAHETTTLFQGFSIDSVVSIFFILLLLIGSALVSGSEIAFFSLSPNDKDTLEGSDKKNAEQVLALLEIPDRLLGGILIANNFINVAIVLVSTFVMHELFVFGKLATLAFIIEVVLITSLLLLFGEIIPKIFAAQNALTFSVRMAGTMTFVQRLFKPLITLLVSSTRSIDKRVAKHKPQLSMSELSDAIDIAADDLVDEVEVEEQKMLKGITTFGEKEASEIMKARVDIIAVETNQSWDEVLEEIRESGYSRIPVYEDSLDTIKGVLYIKDLLPYLKHPSFDWKTIIRPAFFVPENKKINDLLQQFKAKKIHMAIVVDEYGGTSGLITLEDILEEIVGEIEDESDVENHDFVYAHPEKNIWIFEAKTSINDACKVLDEDNQYFDHVKGESESLAGLVLEMKGDFLQESDVLEYQKYEFTILNVDNRRITRIKIKKELNEEESHI